MDVNDINNLADIPMIKGSNNGQIVQLAMLVQNCFHNQNKDRNESVENGTYIEIINEEVAHKYLSDLLSSKLKNNLLTLESEMVNKYKSAATDKVSEQILMAPDQF